MNQDLFPQARKAVEALLAHERHCDKATANGTRYAGKALHKKSFRLGAAVHRGYAKEMLPALLSSGPFVKSRGSVSEGSPIIPLAFILRGGMERLGGKEWQWDMDTLLDHVTVFRRKGARRKVSWADSVLISHPYCLPDHPIVLPPHVEALGLGIWARPDLSSWHSHTTLLVIAKGLPSELAASFGFTDLTRGVIRMR